MNTERHDFTTLEELVVKWAEDKGIFDKSVPFKQNEKTIEEVEELTEALEAHGSGWQTFTNKKGVRVNTFEEIKDAIGDIVVTLIIQSRMHNIDLTECLESAYNVISKRKGKMIDGIFVKSEDLPENEQ